jgi:hypothetical protein
MLQRESANMGIFASNKSIMKHFFSVFGRLLPVVLSLILMGAHFSRMNMDLLVVVPLVLLGLLFVRKAWSVRVIQGALIIGGFEWMRSMFGYISERQATGEDWTRLAIILSVVGLFTILSGLVFFSKKLKAHYRLN